MFLVNWLTKKHIIKTIFAVLGSEKVTTPTISTRILLPSLFKNNLFGTKIPFDTKYL